MSGGGREGGVRCGREEEGGGDGWGREGGARVGQCGHKVGGGGAVRDGGCARGVYNKKTEEGGWGHPQPPLRAVATLLSPTTARSPLSTKAPAPRQPPHRPHTRAPTDALLSSLVICFYLSYIVT